MSSSADSVGSSIEGIDASSLVEASSHANALGTDLESTATGASNASTEIESAADSTSSFAAAARAVATLGLATIFMEAAGAAGTYEDTMSRIGVATGVGASNAGAAWNSTIEEIRGSTGRGAGLVRDYLISMGTLGVTSADVIKSSFEGIAGAAYITGRPIENIEAAFQRVVTSGTLGTRQLVALGLTTQDIYNATGLSVEEVSDKLSTMDTVGRAAYLGQIMNQKYAIEGNEAYKTSWQRVTDALGIAWDYLTRIVGGLILPIVIPAIGILTSLLSGLANFIGNLDPVSKGLLGGVLGLAGGFVLLVGTLGALKFILDTLKISWVLNLLGINASTLAADAHIIATNAQILAQNLLNKEMWISAANYAKDVIVKGAAIALTIAQTAATAAATAAQWLLNAAMTANPIGLVVVAIAALVAGLYLLYQNSDQVRNSINGLWEQLEGLGAYIQSGFSLALDAVLQPFRDVINQIKNLGSGLFNAGRDWIKSLGDGLKASMPELNNTLQFISDHFPKSPAKLGPLSALAPYVLFNFGKSLMDAFGSGIKSSTNWQDAIPTQFRLTAPFIIADGASKLFSQSAATRAADLANTVQEKAQKMTTDIKSSFEQQAEAARQFAEAAKAAYDGAASHASSAFSSMQSMLGAMGISLPKTTYTPIQLLQQRREAINSLQSQLSALKKNYEAGNIASWEYSSTKRQLEEQIKQLNSYETYSAIMKSGQNVGQTWGNGLASGIASSATNINNAIATASRGLIAYSPPKEGPLSTIDLSGENIGRTFIEGISQGLSDSKAMVSSALGGIGLPGSTPLPSSTALSGGTGGVVVQFTGPITIPEGSDPIEVGWGLGQGAGEGLASTLGREVSNMGISTVDVRR